MNEIELNSIFYDFFLLLRPEGIGVEKEKTGLVPIREHQEVAVVL